MGQEGATPLEQPLRQRLAGETLEQLADLMASGAGGPGTHVYNPALAEINRRQTLANLAAAKAQENAANAAQQTARYTRINAWYVLASVIVLALSAVATLGVSLWSAHDTREALVLSNRPHVDFDTEADADTPPVGIAITNAGPGPALIKSITFYVDRKPVADADDAGLNYAHLSKAELDYQELEPGDTLGINEKSG
jgi:hypothetical protein